MLHLVHPQRERRNFCKFIRTAIRLRTMNQAALLWGVLFSSIGLGYFIYGRKQSKLIPLLCGVALMVYPYFMPNTIALFVIGAIFTAVPYFIRR
jgi:hypothetical protein